MYMHRFKRSLSLNCLAVPLWLPLRFQLLIGLNKRLYYWWEFSIFELLLWNTIAIENLCVFKHNLVHDGPNRNGNAMYAIYYRLYYGSAEMVMAARQIENTPTMSYYTFEISIITHNNRFGCAIESFRTDCMSLHKTYNFTNLWRRTLIRCAPVTITFSYRFVIMMFACIVLSVIFMFWIFTRLI